MTRPLFNDCLIAADFRRLFNEMGWDRPAAHGPLALAVDAASLTIHEVAQKCGFHAYVCEVDEWPPPATRRNIDLQLRKYGNDYILVIVRTGTPCHHLWLVPVKTAEKRELVALEYASPDQAAFLYEKIEAISFRLDESVFIVDVTARVQAAFAVNAARITKDFYKGFQQQHLAFAAFIQGLPPAAEADRHWYASVMLNRLMFCYFIQKKGFLDFDFDYLQTRLRLTRERRGRDAFYGSFYKAFLMALFRNGLNLPRHDPAFVAEFGRIPYLNGGLFEEHAIERRHEALDIPDEAFESLFAFFDKWNWHLDTRLTASGRDINPDVLGYIFEQYINDRSRMGAYYTKEDITGYIARNCIIPFLFDAVAGTASARHFKPGGSVWKLLRASGDTYIHDAVKKGVDLPLPPGVAGGLEPDAGAPLRGRRAAWNAPAAEHYALPTEIWRATVARRQRCAALRQTIADGGIASVNDLVTHNLDLRRLAEDLLARTDDHLLIRHFYDALRRLTVLDPTCGSGAFLFAALNILEPLYETCIDRMQAFHQANANLFTAELAEIRNKYRSNIQHYIYKSIILRNLYGVDIMREATEIAKLRLFLKMVAVVDVDKRAENLGLDPLPDIDFNIRCGNTLVGFASPADVKEGLKPQGQLNLFDDVYQQIDTKASDVALVYTRFKAMQLDDNMGSAAFHDAKEAYSRKLAELNTELDIALAKTRYNIKITRESLENNRAHRKWKQTHQPFHWYSEFYEIIADRGGFDVIIGNPPYVATGTVPYAFPGKELLPDLYGHVMLRTLELVADTGRYGMIVPVSFAFSGDFRVLRARMTQNRQSWLSSYDNIPAPLFDGVSQRCTIGIGCRKPGGQTFVTPMHRWRAEGRECLLQNIVFTEMPSTIPAEDGIPKLADGLSPLLSRLLDFSETVPCPLLGTRLSADGICFASAARNFVSVSLAPPPCLDADSIDEVPSTKSNRLPMASADAASVALASLAGELYFWYWLTRGDGFHVTSGNITDYLAALGTLPQPVFALLGRLGRLLDARRNEALVFKKNAGKYVGNYNYRGLFHLTRRADLVTLAGLGIERETALRLFDYVQRTLAVNVFAGEKAIPAAVKSRYPRLGMPPPEEPAVLRDADAFIRGHYGFTDEELDFIVNYDVAFRPNGDPVLTGD